jgi:hypothetical protein
MITLVRGGLGGLGPLTLALTTQPSANNAPINRNGINFLIAFFSSSYKKALPANVK